MPKTKNISRSQWDHTTHSNVATASNHSTTIANGLTAATTLTSPPTRPRLHASRTNSNNNSAMATRHRRSKENSENAAPEKENNGRAGRSTRTHITPGVLSTTFVSSNLTTSTFNSNSILGSKKVLATTSASKPAKPTLTKRRVKKQPLQDVTAQFVASGMGEGANRAGTAYEHLEEEDILALRAQSGGDAVLEGPAVETRVATPGRGHRNQEPTSPLPPSSPPSDYRLPTSLNFNLAASVPLALPPATSKPAAPASPAQSIPVPEYDPWGSFDSAPPVGSPTRPVAVGAPTESKEQGEDEDDKADERDPFGFAALERKLKADRAETAHVMHEAQPNAEEHEDEEDEDIDSILVADTSSPRPDGMLVRRRSNLKRTLEQELDEEDADAAHAYGSSPVVPPRVRACVLSSPVRAAIAAAGPASTPAEASPLHAHFATPPTPHKETHKRRRISAVPDAGMDVAHDVFGPCLPTSSSSPGRVHAESPSPTKGSVRRPAAAAAATTATAHAHFLAHGDDDAPPAAAESGDALDVFNAALDAQEASGAAVEEAEAVGRTLRPRASRAVLADSVKKEKKARSASRGRGRGRGASRGASRSRGRGRGKRVERTEKGADDDEEVEEVDQDEKFEQARQARIAYFRGLDEYEVETEDVYLI